MADLATVGTDEGLDWAIQAPGLAEDRSLKTAVMVSLFTDRRAREEDALPPEDDPRGWWGDALSADGAELGSRLWLLQREKVTSSTLQRAREYALEALQWLVDDRHAQRVEVTVSRASRERLDLTVTLTLPRGAAHWTFSLPTGV